MYGIGADFSISDHVSAVFQYTAAGSDVGMLTVGVRFGF